MNSPSEAINAYRSKGILIDANLLLLLFVGLHGRKRISQFKRTAQFTPEDFDCLMSIIPRFTQIVTTPSILTEVSNMLGQFAGHDRALVFSRFSLGLCQLEEHFTSSSEVSQEPCFLKFGLTDAGIVRAARGQFLVLTDDFRLAGYLSSLGIDTINFNHLRTYLLPDRS